MKIEDAALKVVDVVEKVRAYRNRTPVVKAEVTEWELGCIYGVTDALRKALENHKEVRA